MMLSLTKVRCISWRIHSPEPSWWTEGTEGLQLNVEKYANQREGIHLFEPRWELFPSCYFPFTGIRPSGSPEVSAVAAFSWREVKPSNWLEITL
jgi:hypothetical protein